MKMVAAAKMRIVQTQLDNGREFANWTTKIFSEPKFIDDTAENYARSEDSPGGKTLFLSVSSDKGLCGGVNSYVVKSVKLASADWGDREHSIAIIGDKARPGLSNAIPEKIAVSMNDVWKSGVNFSLASAMTTEAMTEDFDNVVLTFNRFVSVIAYETSNQTIEILNGETEEGSSEEPVLADYEVEPENRAEVIQNLMEYGLACSTFNAMIENAASFQSAQMQAMENATNNANEVIESLTIQYNRARQAKITTELIEIISGASALEG